MFIEFADPAFEAHMLKSYDTDSDGKISADEAKAVKMISVSSEFGTVGSITTLSGIEHFTRLEELYCNGNRISTLDVSGLTKLTTLSCTQNQISTLNVSGLTQLEYLWCSNNQISTLDVSNNAKLGALSCDPNDNLTEIWLTKGQTIYEFHYPLSTEIKYK